MRGGHTDNTRNEHQSQIIHMAIYHAVALCTQATGYNKSGRAEASAIVLRA